MDKADTLFIAHSRRSIRLVAPFALYYELPASLLKAVRDGRLDNQAAFEALAIFLDLPIPIIGTTRASAGAIARAAYTLASEPRCSYWDATFLALAQLLSTNVVTAENKVLRNLKGRTPLLVSLQEYSIP